MLNTISATFGRAALAVSSVLTDSSHFTSFALVWAVEVAFPFEVLTHDFHRLGPRTARLASALAFLPFQMKPGPHPREIAASCGGVDWPSAIADVLTSRLGHRRGQLRVRFGNCGGRGGQARGFSARVWRASPLLEGYV